MLKKVTVNHLKNILELSKSYKSEVYVVGGTLRDLFLGRQHSDFDFATTDASILARQYARSIKSALILLDTTPGRETFRVVVKKNFYFDFSELQGKNIESDLNQRDFSINALAVPLISFIKETNRYIDPHNGRDDIKNKVIRVLPGQIFSKDPLRMLRAFRFMSVLGFQIENKTLKKITRLSKEINRVSPERILSELRLLLSSKKASTSIKAMNDVGLLENIFPELYKSKVILPTFKTLNHLEKLLSKPNQINAKPTKDLKKILLEKTQLIKLGCLLYPLTQKSSSNKIGSSHKTSRKTIASKVLSKLRASNADIDFVNSIIICAHSLSNTKCNFTKDLSSQTTLYQLIYQNDQALVPGLFIYLANRPNLPTSKEWKIGTDGREARYILEFYFQTYLPAKKKEPLLNGNDIQQKLKVKPSPAFATILYKVEEARVLGVIKNKSQALNLARKLIKGK
jgi:tRNA nucleotidyltransferase/poly(A) polymerase